MHKIGDNHIQNFHFFWGGGGEMWGGGGGEEVCRIYGRKSYFTAPLTVTVKQNFRPYIL